MTPTFLSTLIRDFLAHAESIAAGVPADTVLKKQSLSDTKLAKPPRLLVAVDADPEKKHADKIVFVIAVVITAETSINVRATTEAWMKAVRNRIEWGHANLATHQDGIRFQTFQNWIQANRFDAERTGWQIAKLRLFASEEDFSADDETKTYSLSLPMRLTVYLR